MVIVNWRQVIRACGIAVVAGTAGCGGGGGDGEGGGGNQEVDVSECEESADFLTRREETKFQFLFTTSYPYSTPLIVYKNGEEVKRLDEPPGINQPIPVEDIESGDLVQYVATLEDGGQCEVFSKTIE
jgi:hypothetical protein